MAKEGHFRLFDLPDEIWVKITRYAVDHTPKQLPNQLGWCSPDLVRQPAVTRACRSLRVELLPYFYGHHVKLFLFEYHITKLYVPSPATRTWLSAIGPEHRNNIGGTRLFVEDGKKMKAMSDIQRALSCTIVIGEEITELSEDEERFLYGEEKVYPLRFV
ncbi:hypothetical protein LTR56_000117 [Elasticomyces elasticus]|nr:hypothetical protein LTR56_000117 [Elasticomyces elasticus]KAK3667105.1 hypothetical protein LTR22_001969 [Elasticomyces elasticus]KAK4932880.1 hypothetical protein LTR49_000836 [Elasticomyces elasticus]KAK5768716.1 hypothetical protein LTS12_001142 [Elasticomyces elasticus]